MPRRLLAALLVCVVMTMQVGASVAGASGMWNGDAHCGARARLAGPDSNADRARDAGGGGVPAAHDHASCPFCQLGAGAAPADSPASAARLVGHFWRAVITKRDACAIPAVFDRNTPARAPPSHV